MSWPLILAGVLSCAGALIHGVIGDGIVRPAALGDLPATRFGEGGTSRFLIRVAWHFTTIAFATFGIGLVIVGLMPGHAAALGVAYLGGALLSAWAAFGLVASFLRGGARGWISHPAPLLLTIAAALAWCGAASL